MKVWVDGSISDSAAACVSVLDHGLLYGDGVFEGIRVREGRVFALERHMKRLGIGLKALSLGADVAHLREVVLATARAHAERNAYLRLIVTRGPGPLGVDPTSCERPTILCIAASLAVHPAEKLEVGIDLTTASIRRPSADVLDPRVKSLNYLNNAMAKLEARQRGADDAILLNSQGHVAEASVANLFVVRDGELLTPPASDGALEGITRDTVIRLARDLDVVARERTLTRFDLLGADEVFLTGTGAGLVPVRSLDDRPIGQRVPGPVFERFAAAYRELATTDGVPL